VKRATSIFLLFVFCVYSFTYKTHYCYYADSGKRFHGDCEAEQKEAAAKGELKDTNLFPKHYICYDFLKDAQSEQTKIITAKNFSADAFILQPTIEISIQQPKVVEWLIPEFHCRSATLRFPKSLRAPPVV
jgi:hypothetical protein